MSEDASGTAAAPLTPPPHGFAVHFRVRHHEMDALGHVNNAVYLNYLEQAGIEHSAALGYSGELWDATSQTQYLRARSYDPRNGRFIGLDPFQGNFQDPQSLHKYAYVHGDPIQGVDPTGRFNAISISIGVGIGLKLGALATVALGGLTSKPERWASVGI